MLHKAIAGIFLNETDSKRLTLLNSAPDDFHTSIENLDLEVRQMLREDLPAQRDAVLAAITTGELRRARDLVHTVNGSASFCRLRELRDAATALEQQLDNDFAEEDAKSAFISAIDRTLSALS